MIIRGPFGARSPHGRESLAREYLEATTGFEPVNRGFADLRVKPLHHVASGSQPADCAIGAAEEPRGRWLPLEDSNLAQRIQSPLSYH